MLLYLVRGVRLVRVGVQALGMGYGYCYLGMYISSLGIRSGIRLVSPFTKIARLAGDL